MPCVNNEGVKIYYVVEGEGEPIIMLHGFPGSHEEWRPYIDSLKETYQLIVPDLRGNGQSDKPHDSESYLSNRFTSDIVTILDNLDIDRAHCWGYSFGGYIAFCLSRDYPERFRSYIIGGAQPIGQTKEVKENLERANQLIKGGVEGFISNLEERGEKISLETENFFRSWDFEAIRASLNSADLYHRVDEHLPKLGTPFLFYAGELDEWNPYPFLVDISKKMKHAKTILLEGKGHGIDKDTILPQVIKFLENISSDSI